MIWDNHSYRGFDSVKICGNKGSNRKAKPSARVGRKATGLAGETPRASEIWHHRFLRQPGCRSDEAIRFSYFCRKGHKDDYEKADIPHYGGDLYLQR